MGQVTLLKLENEFSRWDDEQASKHYAPNQFIFACASSRLVSALATGRWPVLENMAEKLNHHRYNFLTSQAGTTSALREREAKERFGGGGAETTGGGGGTSAPRKSGARTSCRGETAIEIFFSKKYKIMQTKSAGESNVIGCICSEYSEGPCNALKNGVEKKKKTQKKKKDV